LILSSAVRPTPCATLFPYTTLFRSDDRVHHEAAQERAEALEVLAMQLRNRRVLARVVVHRVEALARRDPVIDGIEAERDGDDHGDRKSTRLNSSHVKISYAVFCLKK